MSDTFRLYRAGMRVTATLGEHKFTGRVVADQKPKSHTVLVSFGNGSIVCDVRSLTRISRNGAEFVR